MRLILCCLLLYLNQSIAHSQNFPDSLTAPAATEYAGIVNRDSLFVAEIAITGNNQTRMPVILREFAFQKGDTIAPGTLGKLMDRSRQNLINTGLFNFVELNHVISGDNLVLNVRLVERWYIWPIPFFEIAETNFNTWWLTRDLDRTLWGLFLSHENFRGRREQVRLKFQHGYTRQYAIQYNIPYLNKAKTLGLGLTASYYTNKEIVYGTTGNKRDFYRDDDVVRRESFYRVLLNYRKKIYNMHSLQLQFNGAAVQDTILQLQPDYFVGSNNKTRYFSAAYSFIRDRRDFKAYPLKGYLFGGEVHHTGFGLFKSEPNLTALFLHARKYQRLSDRFYLAAGGKGKISIPTEQPYYLQRGLGYSDQVVRGYEYYVIDGQHWGYIRSNVKYSLIKPAVKSIGFIASEKFNTFHYAVYLNAFFDGGHVWDALYATQNPLSNSWLYGYGIGLDFVTYYDWTMRLELSRNRMGETGFFINFNAPI